MVTSELDSQKGIKGLVKKLLFIVLVAVAHQLDKLQGIGSMLRTAAEWMLVVNEGISITENLGRAGAPIPKVITEKLKQLREESYIDPKTDN